MRDAAVAPAQAGREGRLKGRRPRRGGAVIFFGAGRELRVARARLVLRVLLPQQLCAGSHADAEGRALLACHVLPRLVLAELARSGELVARARVVRAVLVRAGSRLVRRTGVAVLSWRVARLA